MIKTIRLQEDTWKNLQVLRVAYGYITMEELIKLLISNHKITNQKIEEKQIEEEQVEEEQNGEPNITTRKNPFQRFK
jgi:hypothetical protein